MSEDTKLFVKTSAMGPTKSIMEERHILEMQRANERYVRELVQQNAPMPAQSLKRKWLAQTSLAGV